MMKNSRLRFNAWHRIGLALLNGLILTLACSSGKQPGDASSNSMVGMGGGSEAVGGATTADSGSAPIGELGRTPGSGGAPTGGMGSGGVGSGAGSTGGTSAGGSSGLACSTNNGNCDVLTSCTDNVGAPPTCGACPPGYVGSGATGCTPTLTALVLSAGALTPALASDVTVYAATVRLVSQTITLTPTVPTGATVKINDQAVTSNTPWTSPTLNLGANAVTIVVSQSGHPSRSYALTVTRGMRQEAYVKVSTPYHARYTFGNAVALSADGGTLAIGATGAGVVYVFTRSGGTWAQQDYIPNSSANEFGYSVALSADGRTLAVGARSDSSTATGIDGDQADNSAPYSGAVYVFSRPDGTWKQQAYIKASNTEAYDQFGQSVALSADGNTLAVGAYNESSGAVGVNGNQADNSSSQSGAAYVFTRSGSTWTQQAYIKASNTEQREGHLFGWAVALSGEGDTLAVGAFNESSFGVSGGAVYVFTHSGSTWAQQARLKASNAEPSDEFGIAVALSGDGGTLAVGANGEASNATGIDGNQADNSAPYSGAVYVFIRSGSTWTQQAYLKASATGPGEFGWSLAISEDGGTLAAGARHDSSNATGVNGNHADNSAPGSGAVYVFTRSSSSWTQQAYLKASNTGEGDQFGVAVALSGDGGTLAVGAYLEASNATGINGNQSDNSAADSGAVYVFR